MHIERATERTYDVVLLVEQALTAADAGKCARCTRSIEDPVVYHVLLPLEDAAARIEASIGALGAGDLMAAPAMAMNDVDIEALRQELPGALAAAELRATLARDARAPAARPTGKVTTEPPIDALAAQGHRGRRAARRSS